MLENLLERYRKKDRLALSRLLSLVGRGEHVEEILHGISRPSPPTSPSPLMGEGRGGGESTRVVAITGSAGVGKSTLVGKLIELLRRKNLTVAVLACDPQSPLSGGALLGDRFRMPSQPDEGIFIRSLATAGGQGAVAGHVDAMLRLLEGFGFDVVIIETVGAGQGETAVRDLADVVVLLLQPETGDDLQWEKAGLLEVSDIVAIHKADLPGAESAEAQVRSILSLPKSGQSVPVLRVSAKSGAGLEELWAAIAACPRRKGSDPTQNLLHLAQELLTSRFREAEKANAPALKELLTQWQLGNQSRADVAAALLRLLTSHAD